MKKHIFAETILNQFDGERKGENSNHFYYAFEEALKEPEKVETLILGHKKRPIFADYHGEIKYKRRLSKLSPDIGKFVNLKKLILHSSLGRMDMDSENFITDDFPFEIFTLHKLIELDLSSNQLSELPSEIGELTNLEHLNLSYHYFSELPSEIGNLINLKKLNLSNGLNEYNLSMRGGPSILSTLPATIGKLQNLEELDLSKTPISHLPTEVRELQKLIKLDLSYTNLSDLPSSIFALENLQKLYLNNTRISKISSQISRLTELTELDLSYTDIIELPHEISNLKKLKKVHFTANSHQELPQNIQTVLSKMPNLEIIVYPSKKEWIWRQDLGTDRGDYEIPDNVLMMKDWTHLDISGAHYREFPREILEMKNLVYLHLARTHLKTIPTDITKLENLRELGLSLGSEDFFPHSEIAKLSGLKLEKLVLQENYGLDEIDAELMMQLLPDTQIVLLIWSGADIDERPQSVKNEAMNRDLLKTIAFILDTHPQFRTSINDFLQDEARKNIVTMEQQIPNRIQFINFLHLYL